MLNGLRVWFNLLIQVVAAYRKPSWIGYNFASWYLESSMQMFLSTIIDVAGHAGKINAAFKILQEAKSDGIKVGNMSYSSLMGACCNVWWWIQHTCHVNSCNTFMLSEHSTLFLNRCLFTMSKLGVIDICCNLNITHRWLQVVTTLCRAVIVYLHKLSFFLRPKTGRKHSSYMRRLKQ